MDDRDHVGALLRHVDQLATGSVRELNGVHGSLGSNHVGAVRHRRAGGGTQVQKLAAGLDEDVLHTGHDGGGNLRAERVPHAVLDLTLRLGLQKREKKKRENNKQQKKVSDEERKENRVPVR